MPDIDWGHSMAKEAAESVIRDAIEPGDLWFDVAEHVWYSSEYEHLTGGEKDLLVDLAREFIDKARITTTITFD